MATGGLEVCSQSQRGRIILPGKRFFEAQTKLSGPLKRIQWTLIAMRLRTVDDKQRLPNGPVKA